MLGIGRDGDQRLGRSLEQDMRGWRGYFGFCETPEVLIALTRWVGCGCGPLFGASGRARSRGLCSVR